MSGGVCEPCHGNESTEHRAAVCHLFYVKLGNNVTTIRGKIQQAFGDDALTKTQDFRWHKTFSEGRTFFEDESA
jgi:hypothetical protein